MKGSPDAAIKRHTRIPGTGRLGEHTEAVGENEAQKDLRKAVSQQKSH